MSSVGMSGGLPLFTFNASDRRRMRQALSLGGRVQGLTADNPNVGAVIYRGDRLVGRGATGPGGRPHAEVSALRQADARARGATVYVTLEPCCHTGRSGACTSSLIGAGVTRVVYALKDPNPLVAGKGAEALRAAGIDVQSGLLADEAQRSMAGFLTRIEHGRPHVTLKLATSLDMRSALADGTSQWITDEPARRAGHLLRARSDAVLVGAATVRADQPRLTARLPGLERELKRFVLDPNDELDDHPGWHRLVTRDLDAALTSVAAQGINWLMVESGGRLAASLLAENLVDSLWWASGDQFLGGDSRPAIGNFALQGLGDAPRYRLVESRVLGTGQLRILEPIQQTCLPD